MPQYLTGEALQQARRQVAEGMRQYARLQSCDADSPEAVPKEYWRMLNPPGSRHGTGLLLAFWISPDGREHMVLRAALRPPRRRTITGWRRAFWPEHSDRELKIEEDGPVVIIRTIAPCE